MGEISEGELQWWEKRMSSALKVSLDEGKRGMSERLLR
jgi:hypothetical protein